MDLDLLKLFGTLRPYGSRTNDRLFLRSIRRRAAYFIKHSPEYRAICEDAGFHPAVLKNMKSLEQIPVIPTPVSYTHLTMVNSVMLKDGEYYAAGTKRVDGCGGVLLSNGNIILEGISQEIS